MESCNERRPSGVRGLPRSTWTQELTPGPFILDAISFIGGSGDHTGDTRGPQRASGDVRRPLVARDPTLVRGQRGKMGSEGHEEINAPGTTWGQQGTKVGGFCDKILWSTQTAHSAEHAASQKQELGANKQNCSRAGIQTPILSWRYAYSKS